MLALKVLSSEQQFEPATESDNLEKKITTQRRWVARRDSGLPLNLDDITNREPLVFRIRVLALVLLVWWLLCARRENFPVSVVPYHSLNLRVASFLSRIPVLEDVRQRAEKLLTRTRLVTVLISGALPGSRIAYDIPEYVVPKSIARTSFRFEPW